MLAGSSLKYENQLSTAWSRPIRPDATSSRTATHDGCWRYMNASISSTPASAQASTIVCASPAVSASGFSHSTCLPARAAAIVHARVEVVRQRDVDGVDVGVREQRLVRPVRPRDPQPGRHLACPPGSRDAIPRTSLRGDRRRPGMTFPSRCSPSTGRPSGAVDRRLRSWPGSVARGCPTTAPSTHLPRAPPGTGADLTRTRVWPSLAHVCKKGSQTLRVGRVDVGQRSETVHRANLSAIVRGLHEHGPQSRSELVAATGLTRSAIRALVGELAAAGLVTEGSAVPSRDAGPALPPRPAELARRRGPQPRDPRRLDRGRDRRPRRRDPRARPGRAAARRAVGRRRRRGPRGPRRRPAGARRLADRRHRRRRRRRRAARRRPRVDGPEPRLGRRPARRAPRARAVRRRADQQS